MVLMVWDAKMSECLIEWLTNAVLLFRVESVEYLALENDLTCLVVIVQSEVILSA